MQSTSQHAPAMRILCKMIVCCPCTWSGLDYMHLQRLVRSWTCLWTRRIALNLLIGVDSRRCP